MIQRIQSIFLLIAGLTLASSVFFNLVDFSNSTTGEIISLSMTKLLSSDSSHVLAQPLLVSIAPIAVGLLSLAILGTIFLFKDRKRQLQICNINFILTLGFLVFILITPDKVLAQLGDGFEQKLGIAYYLPVASILGIILAQRAIKKDIALVQSADRLR